jgi:hypothetical protein
LSFAAASCAGVRLNCTNVTTVGAPEKVYECVSSDAFNCLPKSQFAAAMRTGLTDANRTRGNADFKAAQLALFGAAAPAQPATYLKSADVRSASSFDIMGIQVRSSADIELALRKLPGFGLVVVPDAFANVNRARIIKSAAENRIPATYPYQQFVLDGGLMTYGPDPADIVRRSAAYVDRILKGSKPAELPVQGATKFEFVVNLKTAKALGLEVLSTLLSTADEVIE